MKKSAIPMVPGRKSSLPRIYGDTPSFLGCPVIHSVKEIKGYDVIIMGVPWEGTITWGSYSGCELAPKAIRHAAARYGGFLPEYGLNLFDYLVLGDFGDISVEPGNAGLTMRKVNQKAKKIYEEGAVPLTIGGDHSFTPEIVRALCKYTKGKIGIIHFDAHFDNSARFGYDRYARCSPIYRISKIPQVENTSIVHIGIRGPRNTPEQAEYARSIGATIFTIKDIHEMGIEEIIDRTINIAYRNTDRVYVTICSDVIDIAFNPGGPIDFDGLTPHELFYSLNRLGKEGIAGMDFVESYPLQDDKGISSHLACWAFINALVGMAARKKENTNILNELSDKLRNYESDPISDLHR